MRTIVKNLLVLFCLFNIGIVKSQKLNNDIFGLDFSDSIPKMFASGIVSTEYAEFGISISPDLSEIYFTRRGEQPSPRNGKIMVMKMTEGNWQKPEIAPFSGKYNDMEPLITPDGKKLIFGSNRPLPGKSEFGNYVQWYVERNEQGWSEPKVLEVTLNKGFVMYPTVAENGNLYYTAEDGIYVLYYENGNYQRPEKLGDAVNSLPMSAHPYINPDEKFLIFDAQPRGSMKSDLFISYNNNGEWTKAVKLKGQINSAETQAIPFITYDGKYLFFVRNGDIYFIKTKYINEILTVVK